METDDQQEVKYFDQSNDQFMVLSQNSFIVLSDEKTFIAFKADLKNEKANLIMEDITGKAKPVRIGNNNKFVTTFTLIEESNMLLVVECDFNGQNPKLIQYKLNPKASTWSIIKDYGDLGIEQVFSYARIGKLVIFGGQNYCLRVVDFEEMRLVGDPYETAIKQVFSLSICEVSETRVLLSVNGNTFDYSEKKSDILNITELLNQNNIDIIN
jgi:hypothetical protein